MKDPYAFYAVSNIGSLGALLAYPIVIEPNLSVSTSAAAWTWGFRIVALLVVTLSVALWAARPASAKRGMSPMSLTCPLQVVMQTLAWIFFSAVGSGLLVSFTSRMTQDIAPIPLLWIIPLSLYLLTFIVCFGGLSTRIDPAAGPHRLRASHIHQPPLRLAGPRFSHLVLRKEGSRSVESRLALVLTSSAFFLLVMLLHGELYALRPGLTLS